MPATIQLRRGTAAQWTATNPVLAAGEPGVETDTGRFKVGNGSTAWASLSYIPATIALSAFDINGGTDIGAAIADTDTLAVYDASATANRKTDASRIPTYVFSKVSGDVTVNSSGVAAIGSTVIVDADINASAAIAHSKLANITAGSVLIGNASNVPTATALSGDVTVTSGGVTAIGSNVIVNADVNASAAIDFSKLASLTFGSVIMGNNSNVPTATVVHDDQFLLSSQIFG